MSHVNGQGSPDPRNAPAFPARSRQAGLAVEDDKKRALRERVEVLEAQDLDQLERDLKGFSDAFNRRLQALVNENRPVNPRSAEPQSQLTDHNSPFGSEVITQPRRCSAHFCVAAPTNLPMRLEG
ncbi:hypothetical protein MYCTH_2308263 [Thermothelomyces thermophilus ATCC 42464]|uniref:Uncharacterized protein n=1 Tax=Thermothelomyces thermophilus (strain ATCC 42464 / BCRC 31852 / DSM 1799) TaxID=573729 RepID=G2QJJ1_THET4|nr:uncharacterized protein MYCTH_2308263 [Thermothelomyces thermophilus ATCC 42464]AEO59748.1 hypothetical protein MYCTH_2308263 [Thermothelomyces thermophilus ATCC 42464]